MDFFSTWPTTADRNNYNGSTGFSFTMINARRITRLGRLYVAGNTHDHVISLYDGSTHDLLARGTVLAASASENGFKFVDVTPVISTPGASYVIAGDEVIGEDVFKDVWQDGTGGQTNTAEITLGGDRYGAASTYPASVAVGAGFMFNALAIDFASPRRKYRDPIIISRRLLRRARR